jgi:hypothetical protein
MSSENKPNRHLNQRLAGGLILILFGTAILLERWLNVGVYAILLIGVAMLLWGSFSHTTGWIIPGGVLTGIGAGILAMGGPWDLPIEGQSGIFLLCFALGWFLITVLTALFTCTQWWALIPGGIMAVLGGGILVTNGAVSWLDVNMIYAALLILAGLALLVFGVRSVKKG